MDDDTLAIDEQLHEISQRIDTNLINPLNAEGIKRELPEQPDFTYADVPDFSTTQKTLRALTFPKTPEGELLRKKKEYLLQKTRLLSSLGTPRFSSLSRKIHPPPEPSLVRAARDILEEPRTKSTEKVRLMDAYEEMQATIDELGIPWRVQKINMLASASVMPSQRLLYLKRKGAFGRRFIERLKIHEIGTHAVRAENGRLQPLKIFLHGLAGYLSTEEGLAVYNEERFGLLDSTVFRTYAGRVMAVDLAQRKSFGDVVEELKNFFPERKAVTLALRAKRGVKNSTEKGGYTKDVVYLRGYKALKQFEAEGGDFRPLYYGKVGLGDLPILERCDWLVPPKYFPEMISPK